MSDRNMRRLLDAVKKAPLTGENFALLKRPRWEQPSEEELRQINENAMRFFDGFERSGSKNPGVKGGDWSREIQGILRQVEALDHDQQTYVLQELGVTPIWYEDHADITDYIAEIPK